MIKGFAITPIVDGRIGIGEVVDQGGKRLPKKLDHIVLTKMHQTNGAWAQHPEMARLIQEQQETDPKADKLRSIPVRIMFDRPDNNFRAEYTCFDDKARLVCSGNGETAKRRDPSGVKDVGCPGTDVCEFGKQNRCKQFARLIVGMESTFEHDPLVGFMFRTTSFNSIRSLSFRLEALAAATKGTMAGMPCNLVMKAKSTAGSFRKPIYYLDLEPAGGLIKAAKVAADYHKAFLDAGLSRDQLEAAVAEGIAESAFFEGGDDGEEIVEEFYAENEEEKGGKTNTDCSPEQVAEIERLLTLTGKERTKLLAWLIKPADAALASLSAEEASRSIAVLTPKQKTAPAAAADAVA